MISTRTTKIPVIEHITSTNKFIKGEEIPIPGTTMVHRPSPYYHHLVDIALLPTEVTVKSAQVDLVTFDICSIARMMGKHEIAHHEEDTWRVTMQIPVADKVATFLFQPWELIKHPGRVEEQKVNQLHQIDVAIRLANGWL